MLFQSHISLFVLTVKFVYQIKYHPSLEKCSYVVTKNGNISVQMAGITVMQMLSAGNLDFHLKVYYYMIQNSLVCV